MAMDAVPTTDSDDLAALRDAAGRGRGVSEAHLGRVLAMQRRRQLSQGKRALNGDGDRTAAAAGGAPTFVVHRGGAC